MLDREHGRGHDERERDAAGVRGRAGPVHDEHELVVLKSDLVPTTLPLGGNGGVDEAGAGVTKIGEIEPFPAGQTREATFELAPGKYVLICNIVDTSETPTEVHYKLGMLAGFTVS
jgi:hypothetical protein